MPAIRGEVQRLFPEAGVILNAILPDKDLLAGGQGLAGPQHGIRAPAVIQRENEEILAGGGAVHVIFFRHIHQRVFRLHAHADFIIALWHKADFIGILFIQRAIGDDGLRPGRHLTITFQPAFTRPLPG
ncbi:MAG: hypothetical protein BWY76_00770 [bacterium ADurb.Bin429]|nr:MAG: hypothetical protein BWY76_00770 [bacterium ADurb.Bin429]